MCTPLIAAENPENTSLIFCDLKSLDKCTQSCQEKYRVMPLLAKLGFSNAEQKQHQYKNCAVRCKVKHCMKVHVGFPLSNAKT